MIRTCIGAEERRQVDSHGNASKHIWEIGDDGGNRNQDKPTYLGGLLVIQVSAGVLLSKRLHLTPMETGLLHVGRIEMLVLLLLLLQCLLLWLLLPLLLVLVKKLLLLLLLQETAIVVRDHPASAKVRSANCPIHLWPGYLTVSKTKTRATCTVSSLKAAVDEGTTRNVRPVVVVVGARKPGLAGLWLTSRHVCRS